MKILLVKMSSMGDVIHTLPAITDAVNNIPDIEIHWLVEEAFQEIPAWHPAVKKVIPLGFRRLRKSPIKMLFSKEWKHFIKEVNAENYDLVLDAQGLIKSAFLAKKVKHVEIAGLDKHSAREPLASRSYDKVYFSAKNQHAVERTRELFAKALAYEKPKQLGDFGIHQKFGCDMVLPERFVFFIHATTWPSKHWPEVYWQELASKVTAKGYAVCIPWVNDTEKARAEAIAKASPQVMVLPKLSLQQVAAVIQRAQAAVAVDTGLGHLTAALDVPAVSLYGPTSPEKVGAYGKGQRYLEAAVFAKASSGSELSGEESNNIEPKEMAPILPDVVLRELTSLLQQLNTEGSTP